MVTTTSVIFGQSLSKHTCIYSKKSEAYSSITVMITCYAFTQTLQYFLYMEHVTVLSQVANIFLYFVAKSTMTYIY